jgi:hypothetical protein
MTTEGTSLSTGREPELLGKMADLECPVLLRGVA